MDGQRFDAMTKALATGTSRRDALRALGGVAGALLALVGRSAATAEGKPAKVAICHKGQTKFVPASALAGHLRHGDTAGACCSKGTATCGASCCADCFGQRDPNTGDVSPFCCPPQLVCAGATTASSDDQCCYEDEDCFPPNSTCCRSNQDGTCTVEADCAGCCRTCGTDGAGNTVCCDQTEQCVTDPVTNAKTCESLNTARLGRSRF